MISFGIKRTYIIAVCHMLKNRAQRIIQKTEVASVNTTHIGSERCYQRLISYCILFKITIDKNCCLCYNETETKG